MSAAQRSSVVLSGGTLRAEFAKVTGRPGRRGLRKMFRAENTVDFPSAGHGPAARWVSSTGCRLRSRGGSFVASAAENSQCRRGRLPIREVSIASPTRICTEYAIGLDRGMMPAKLGVCFPRQASYRRREIREVAGSRFRLQRDRPGSRGGAGGVAAMARSTRAARRAYLKRKPIPAITRWREVWSLYCE